MGRSTTPRYAMRFGRILDARTGRPVTLHAVAWRVASSGRPTIDNLRRWVERHDDLNIGSAEIYDQFTGAVKARYVAPMFRAILTEHAVARYGYPTGRSRLAPPYPTARISTYPSPSGSGIAGHAVSREGEPYGFVEARTHRGAVKRVGKEMRRASEGRARTRSAPVHHHTHGRR